MSFPVANTAQRRRMKKKPGNDELHKRHKSGILPVWWNSVAARNRVAAHREAETESGRCIAAVPHGRKWRPCKGSWWLGRLCYQHHPDGARCRKLAREYERKADVA